MQASQKYNPWYLWAEDIFPHDAGITVGYYMHSIISALK